MGALNASLALGKIISDLQQECQAELEHQNIWECVSETIMHEILLSKILPAIILHYFEVVL